MRTEQDLIVLRCLLTRPKWGAEIAEALGFTKWSQRQNGIYHGERLTKLGLCTRKVEMRKPGRRKIYFTISHAGRAALGAPEEFRIGKYRVDYSGLTEAEIAAAQPPEIEDLMSNSISVNRRDARS